MDGHPVSVGAVVVDHQLQPGSADVAAATAVALRELGLSPVQIRTVDVASTGMGPEAAARDARHAALEAAADDTGAGAILLGHTLDDQAEQVLLGLARGSGTRSLAGMRPARGRLLRPFLGLRRADTLAICEVEGLDPWHDPSNADPAFARSRTRVEVLPLLEEKLGPGVAESLARTAAILQLDADYLEDVAEDTYRPAPGTVRGHHQPPGGSPARTGAGREVPGHREGRGRRRRPAAQLPAPARRGSTAPPAGVGRSRGAPRRGQRLPALARAAPRRGAARPRRCSPRSGPLWEACIPASKTAQNIVAPASTQESLVDSNDVQADLKHVLYSKEQIQTRITELAAQIDKDYEGRDLLIVGVLKGAVMVMADLARALHSHVSMDWMAVSSYGSGTQSSGVVRILKDLDTDLMGKDVLIVEDIIDSGLTLSWLKTNLESRGTASVEICTAFRKPTAAKVQIDVKYVGYDIPNEFVVGYGLDYAEKYRNLDFVGTLAPHVYE